MEFREVQDLDEAPPQPARARTGTVIVFLAAFAMILSYIIVYAVPNALIAADVLSPRPAGGDERPMMLLRTFFTLFGIFVAVGAVFCWASRRQLRRIERMAEAE